ncbi:hypothetical protein KAR91_57295 [Candidatus Pacearchaeota archaeon]|nr:hypothetical protein [Candidatus Pacearchaeota archaeon]
MWKPHRYPNQKARYAEETQQVIEQAALIAAAPDLLAACKRFPNEHEHADDCDCRWCEVKQAIAAAELTS